MPIISYDSIEDLGDQLLFEKQKAFFLESIALAYDHLNFTRHQRKNLIRLISESAFMIFSNEINYEFPPDTISTDIKRTYTN